MKLPHAPIKRSQELAPFSREHHEALLFVWKIRQGIKYKTDISILASYCRWFWENYLNDHFQKEEAAFKGVLPANNPMLEKMLDDHDAIRSKIEQLTQFPAEQSFERLAQIIQYHVRFEERELFAYMQQTLTEAELEMIATHDNKPGNDVDARWEDSFWINDKSGL